MYIIVYIYIYITFIGFLIPDNKKYPFSSDLKAPITTRLVNPDRFYQFWNLYVL